MHWKHQIIIHPNLGSIDVSAMPTWIPVRPATVYAQLHGQGGMPEIWITAIAEINIDPYLVVATAEPQCLNNVQGANCIDQSAVQPSKDGLSTEYSTEHPHNRATPLPTKTKVKAPVNAGLY
jgi:hypothetical protein